MIGIVYKIICKLDISIVYVGSTFKTLHQRYQGHLRTDYKINQRCSIFLYFEKYGRENFEIIKIKEYDVVDEKHLRVYEFLWYKKLKAINKCSPFSINKLYKKSYYLNNKKYYLEKEQKRYNENKQQYYQNTKENRIKHIVNKTYVCEKCKYVADSSYKLNRHFQSKKHNDIL